MTTLAFAEAISADARERIARILAGFEVGLADGTAVDVLAGGASNANYLVTEPGGRRRVLRVASDASRFGIDRWRGVGAHATVAAAGLAPGVVAATLPAGHLLAEFAEGEVLDADAIRRDDVLERVGATLRAAHAAGRIPGSWSVFADHRRSISMARAEGLSLPDDIDALADAATAIERLFAAADVADALCHNDLQIPNFIVQADRVVVLDWEYAGMGNPYFDLGAVAVNAGLDAAEVTRLAGAYFGAARAADLARIELMTFMSALREACWAVIAAPVLALDWDYAAWADAYFARCRGAAASGRLAAALEAAA